MDKNTIMIEVPLEEYKELLIIKGKYEELKESSKPHCTGPCKPNIWPTIPTFTWTTYDDDSKKRPEEDYKVTLKNNTDNTYATVSSTYREDKRRKR